MSRKVGLRKRFPDDFGDDVVKVLEAMSMTRGAGLRVLGSGGLRSQAFAGDYDAYEIVEGSGSREAFVARLVEEFKSAVRRVMDLPLTYVGDIKAGSVEEWKVLPNSFGLETATKGGSRVVGYDPVKIRSKLEELKELKVIDGKEFKDAMGMVKDLLTVTEALKLKKALRYNIVRWSPAECLRGEKRLVDGRVYTLAEAFQSPTITKMDVVSWVGGSRFTDFSCIYEFRLLEKRRGQRGTLVPLNEGFEDIEKSLKENIVGLRAEGKYFKMAKRMFALARYMGRTELMGKLSPLFNGDLGRLYMVYGDIGTLEYLLENEDGLPYERIEFEIGQFKNRLANVVRDDYLKKEEGIYNIIERLVDLPNRSKSNPAMLKLLGQMGDELLRMLNRGAGEYLRSVGISIGA